MYAKDREDLRAVLLLLSSSKEKQRINGQYGKMRRAYKKSQDKAYTELYTLGNDRILRKAIFAGTHFWWNTRVVIITTP